MEVFCVWQSDHAFALFDVIKVFAAKTFERMGSDVRSRSAYDMFEPLVKT